MFIANNIVALFVNSYPAHWQRMLASRAGTLKNARANCSWMQYKSRFRSHSQLRLFYEVFFCDYICEPSLERWRKRPLFMLYLSRLFNCFNDSESSFVGIFETKCRLVNACDQPQPGMDPGKNNRRMLRLVRVVRVQAR